MFRILDLSAILVIVFIFCCFFVTKTRNHKLFLMLFIFSCIIISFRTIGDDTAQYVGIYNAVVPHFTFGGITAVNGFQIEPLWLNFITALKLVGLNTPHVFFFLSVFLSSFAILWVYKKSRLFPASVTALFYCFFWLILYQFAINGVRAFSSCCFVFLSLWFFYDRKLVKCLMSATLAVLLHTSGFIVLLFLFLFKFKVSAKSFKILLFVLIIFVIGVSQLNWDEPYLMRVILKLEYYLFSVESDMFANNQGRELYVYFARALFVASTFYSMALLLISMDFHKNNEFINGLYKCSFFTALSCIVMMAFGIYLFSYRLIMFIQPGLIFITLYSMVHNPKFYKMHMFIIATAIYWAFFILYASRFYDQ